MDIPNYFFFFKLNTPFVIFLQNSPHLDKESLMFCGERVVWHRPTSLEELLVLKSKYPHAKLVNGNTEVGMYEQIFLQFWVEALGPFRLEKEAQ